MPKKNKNRAYVFFFLLSLLIIFINSPYITPALDCLMGVKWSKPIVTLLQANSQGLVVAFLIAFYWDVIRSKKPTIVFGENNITISNGVTDILAQFDTREVIKILLNGFFKKHKDNGNVNNIVDLIIPDKEIYTDVRIKYTLVDNANDPAKYVLDYEIEFTSKLKEYVLAVVTNPEMQCRISNNCSLVCDVITIPTLQYSDLYSDDLLKKIDIHKISKDSSGQTRKTPLVMKRVTARDSQKYLTGIKKDDCESVLLFKAQISSDTEVPCTILLSTPEFELDKDDHYIYWVSDRPMWVNQIEFDVSKFTFDSRKKFNVQPLIVNYKINSNLNKTNDKVILWLHDWIGNGCGVIFSWR